MNDVKGQRRETPRQIATAPHRHRRSTSVARGSALLNWLAQVCPEALHIACRWKKILQTIMPRINWFSELQLSSSSSAARSGHIPTSVTLTLYSVCTPHARVHAYFVFSCMRHSPAHLSPACRWEPRGAKGMNDSLLSYLCPYTVNRPRQRQLVEEG